MYIPTNVSNLPPSPSAALPLPWPTRAGAAPAAASPPLRATATPRLLPLHHTACN